MQYTLELLDRDRRIKDSIVSDYSPHHKVFVTLFRSVSEAIFYWFFQGISTSDKERVVVQAPRISPPQTTTQLITICSLAQFETKKKLSTILQASRIALFIGSASNQSSQQKWCQKGSQKWSQKERRRQEQQLQQQHRQMDQQRLQLKQQNSNYPGAAQQPRPAWILTHVHVRETRVHSDGLRILTAELAMMREFKLLRPLRNRRTKEKRQDDFIWSRRSNLRTVWGHDSIETPSYGGVYNTIQT